MLRQLSKIACGDLSTDPMNETPQSEPDVKTIVETIPDDLLELWKMGPLMLASSARLPVVELCDRQLTLRWCYDVIAADVAECHFRIGRPWKMKHNSRSARPLLPFGNHDLILIDFPPLYRGFFTGRLHSYNTAPVGYTKTSLQRWKRALAPLIADSGGALKSPVTHFLES